MFPRRVLPARVFAVFRIVCGEDAAQPGKCPPDTGAIMATRSCKNGGFCLDRPFGAKHRLKQRINKGVPAGGGWLGRQGGSARSGDRSDETRGAALPPGARLNLAINIPGLTSQFFWFSKTCCERYASTGMPPAGQSASLLRKNARRAFFTIT
jgi:hypothetical protein